MPERRRGPLLAGIVVALLAALTALVLWALRDDAAPPPPARTPDAAVSPAPPRPAPQRPRTDRAPRSADRPPAAGAASPSPPDVDPASRPQTVALRQTLRLRVTVRRAGGAPASGASVLALDPLGRYLDPPGPVVRGRKVADGEGKAEFDVAGGTTVLRVLASCEGEAALSDPLDVADGKDRNVTIDLACGGAECVCTTVDEDDAPVAGAEVVLTTEAGAWPLVLSAASDADGRAAFTVPDPGPNGWLHLAATAPGRAPAEATVRANVGGVRLVLPRAVTVRGRVVDEEGRPVAGARAKVEDTGVFAESGADGAFALQALPPTGGTLVVTKPGLAPAIVGPLRGDAGDVGVGDVVLTKGGTVTGVVLDPSGAPVEGADVILSAVGADSVGTSVTTDAEGRFTFDAVTDTDHSLLVQESAAKGQWSTRRKATVAPVRPGRGEVRVSLDGRATVVLRFLNDSDRSPVVVGSVKLSAKAAGPTPAQFAWAWSGANISAVRFQPDHAGVFDVTIEVPGWSPATAAAVEVLPDRETTIDVLFRRAQ